jgi:hypothetical protein
MRSEGSDVSSATHNSTAHPPIPGLGIGTTRTSYRTMELAMNMISRSHGLHMKDNSL